MSQRSLDGIVHMNGDPFHKRYIPTAQKITPLGTSKFQHLIDLIEKLCHMATEYQQEFPDEFALHAEIRKDKRFIGIDDKLTSDEIQQFLAATSPLDQHKDYPIVTGLLATKLMQNAHNAGLTDFEFNLHGVKPLLHFGSYLERQKNRNLTVIVYGELGRKAFDHAACSSVVEIAGEGFAYEAQGKHSVKRYRNLWTPESTIFRSHDYPINKPIRYIQRGPSLEDRYIVIYTDQHRSPYLRDQPEGYYFCDQKTKDMVLRSSIRQSYTLPLTEFNTMWQPAVEPFQRMRQLFGGKP